ncbi:MAG: caspase family protein, partial [Acidimicrobiales bacterium]
MGERAGRRHRPVGHPGPGRGRGQATRRSAVPSPGYRALLVGNSRFPEDPHNLQGLKGPLNDVPALQAALTDAEVGLFLPESVRTVTDATASEMLIELERFFTSAHRDDTTLLFYSGHGLLDDANRLYLCARDTRSDLMRATAVSADGLNGMIDASASQTTVIMLDCCYSGAFKSGQLPDSLRGTGRYLLTSCRGSQLANDASEAHGTSMFTEHLVEGLRGAAPDANHDGYVNLSDIYDYVHGALAAESRQIPQRNFAGGGDVTIARRPAANDQDADGAGGADLDLSETVIDLRDVRPGEPLPTERVYVRSRRGAPLDWTTHTDADWL